MSYPILWCRYPQQLLFLNETVRYGWDCIWDNGWGLIGVASDLFLSNIFIPLQLIITRSECQSRGQILTSLGVYGLVSCFMIDISYNRVLYLGHFPYPHTHLHDYARVNGIVEVSQAQMLLMRVNQKSRRIVIVLTWTCVSWRTERADDEWQSWWLWRMIIIYIICKEFILFDILVWLWRRRITHV